MSNIDNCLFVVKYLTIQRHQHFPYEVLIAKLVRFQIIEKRAENFIVLIEHVEDKFCFESTRQILVIAIGEAISHTKMIRKVYILLRTIIYRLRQRHRSRLINLKHELIDLHDLLVDHLLYLVGVFLFLNLTRDRREHKNTSELQQIKQQHLRYRIPVKVTVADSSGISHDKVKRYPIDVEHVLEAAPISFHIDALRDFLPFLAVDYRLDPGVSNFVDGGLLVIGF